MNINVLEAEEAVKSAVKNLNSLLEAQQGKPFLFLISGGSAFALLHEINANLFGEQSTIAVLDERYSIDPEINNFAQLEKTEFYTKIKERGAHFIDTKAHLGETIETVATHFEAALREWAEKTNGTIIATAGIGPDAHTSGIMPYPESPSFFEKVFNNEKQWVAHYDAENKNSHRLRITTTLPFLRKINAAVIYVAGVNKKQALRQYAAENGNLAESPCRIWREIPNAVLYTDQSIY